MKHILCISAAFLLLFTLTAVTSCSSDDVVSSADGKGVVTITSDVMPFDGEENSRVNVAGNSFLDGDFIRLKIICPFVSSTERGETTDGYSSDAMYYLKRSGNAWVRVMAADGFDIYGTYSPSNSPDIGSYYEAQQTPYVYVASTFSEERRFVANGSLYDHLTPVFHANQTKEKHYRASDVLWAQTFMQTGAWNIHLGFQHKMACLDITIADGVTLTDAANAVLTLEGMPDIDQAEIVIGDYYADASKINSGYGYQQKSSCSYENNGKVLGVAVNDEVAKRAKIAPMTGNPVPGGGNSQTVAAVPNTGTYTAYMVGARHYRLIVPPCVLTTNAVFWLRDGSKRYSVALENKTFVEGKLYPVTLKPVTENEE
ncbi:MAG: fimbrillin family protein [Prevotella sp.]|nr:fimbrillin family protein [Candidatus Prevotella equi]